MGSVVRSANAARADMRPQRDAVCRALKCTGCERWASGRPALADWRAGDTRAFTRLGGRPIPFTQCSCAPQVASEPCPTQQSRWTRCSSPRRPRTSDFRPRTSRHPLRRPTAVVLSATTQNCGDDRLVRHRRAAPVENMHDVVRAKELARLGRGQLVVTLQVRMRREVLCQPFRKGLRGAG